MESETSASRQSRSKDSKFLGLKRESQPVKDNYLFRRLTTGNVSGRYEKLADTYLNMMAFDWEEEKIAKLRTNPMSNVNAMAIWFYVCSAYFPYASNQFLDEGQALPKMLETVIERIVNNKKQLKKKSQTLPKQKFINDISSFFEMEEDLSSDISVNPEPNIEKSTFEKINERSIVKSITPNKNQQFNSSIHEELIAKENLKPLENQQGINLYTYCNNVSENKNENSNYVSNQPEIYSNSSLSVPNIPNFNPQISVNDVIEFLEDKLKSIEVKKNLLMLNLISELSKQDNYICSLERDFVFDREEILQDMQYQNPYTNKFRSYLISKHETDTEFKSKVIVEESENSNNLNTHNFSLSYSFEKKENFEKIENSDNLVHNHNSEQLQCHTSGVILSRAEEERDSNPDDIVCLICNDGDYEDNDLIVYCSSCGMTVHQSCYGIVVIPNDDWNCYPCLAFGLEKAKLQTCILCPVKGGAMKPSQLKRGTQPYTIIMNLRNEIKPSLSNVPIINCHLLENQKSNIISFDMSQVFNNNYKNFIENNNNSAYETPVKIERNGEYVKQDRTLTEESENETKEYNEHTYENLEKLETPINSQNKLRNANNLFKKEESSEIVETDKTNKMTEITVISSSSPKRRGRRKKMNKKDYKKNNTSSKNNEELNNILNEYLTPKIIRENCWVHLSCAIWHSPYVNIADYDKKEDIKGIEYLPKDRFQEYCSICKLNNYGPTIKCENEKCSLRFHVECARINKYLLEKVNNYTGETKFYIYCQTHRPHRLIKNSELCRSRTIDDIEHFADILKKNYEILNKLDKRNDFSVYTARKNFIVTPLEKKIIDKEERLKIKNSKKDKTGVKFKYQDKSEPSSKMKSKQKDNIISKKEKTRVMKKIREILIEMSNMAVFIYKSSEIDGDESYSIKSEAKEKITISYEETLNPEIFPWYLLKGVSRLTSYEAYMIYSRDIVPNHEAYNRIILKKPAIKLKKNKVKKQPEILYCVCKTNQDSELMIACYYGEEGGNICIHNGWVHRDCIEELKNIETSVLESDDFIFACKECKEKFGEPRSTATAGNSGTLNNYTA